MVDGGLALNEEESILNNTSGKLTVTKGGITVTEGIFTNSDGETAGEPEGNEGRFTYDINTAGFGLYVS